MKMIRLACLICLFFGAPSLLSAQQKSFEEELRFANYLIGKSLYQEALDVLSKLDTAGMSSDQKDIFFYTIGWAAYQFKELELAETSLMKVSSHYEEYRKSRAFAAYTLAHRGNYKKAEEIYNTVPVLDSIEAELILVQHAGLALLQKQYKRYDSLRKGFSYSSYLFQQEETRMDRFHSEMMAHKTKSPFLAGLYSAVIPGAGKWYAGKKKQAIAAFLPVASLGAVAYEAYRKGGVKSARFIVFGSIFSLFYVGNIWGSALSVNVERNEFNREYENKILFNMHIPLRNLYN